MPRGAAPRGLPDATMRPWPTSASAANWTNLSRSQVARRWRGPEAAPTCNGCRPIAGPTCGVCSVSSATGRPRRCSGGREPALARDALSRLDRLARAARREPGAPDFAAAVEDFRATFRARLAALDHGEALPHDLTVVIAALALWSGDPGNQWGEGVWDSEDLVRSAADHTVPPVDSTGARRTWPRCSIARRARWPRSARPRTSRVVTSPPAPQNEATRPR